MSRRKRRSNGFKEINVVPYVDVMLVLLIIFMISAPVIKRSVQVELPVASAKPIENTSYTPLVITVDAKKRYYVNVGKSSTISPIALKQLIRTTHLRTPNRPCYLQADKRLSYGEVMQVMHFIQSAGIQSVGLVTDQPKKGRG